MYKTGDLVVYGIHGVCRVLELEERIVERKQLKYYVLQPVGQAGARFLIPTHNAVAVGKLHPVLSRQDLEELLHSEKVHEDTWISDENMRKQTYREMINSGDRAALIRMVGTLRRYKEERLAAGKKFHMCDDNFLRDAEKLLNSEFSLVLGIEPDQVGEYVRSALQAE